MSMAKHTLQENHAMKAKKPEIKIFEIRMRQCKTLSDLLIVGCVLAR
jgi:hypothetical protein